MLHRPVLLTESIAALSPQQGQTYVDATFGVGGYSRALLESEPDCRVIALDRDPYAKEHANVLEKKYTNRFVFIQGNFADIRHLITAPIDGLVADIGVSSPQLDRPERGFSFQADGPLDMRMDPEDSGPTAADIVNTSSENTLADILYTYGGERRSRRIARHIVHLRPFTRTGALADAIRAVVPRGPKDAIDPATRSFQALRIVVNDEIDALKALLSASPYLLNPGGRLVVVAFHSLEDSIIKDFLRNTSGTAPEPSRHAPLCDGTKVPLFTLGTRKVITPSATEIAQNPRARSARMRWAIRTQEMVL